MNTNRETQAQATAPPPQKPKRRRGVHIQFFLHGELAERMREHAEKSGLGLTAWIKFTAAKALRRKSSI